MKNQWWLGPLVAFAVLAVFLLIPPIEPLTDIGMRTVGIFTCTMILWATVSVGWPSILCLVLFALAGVMDPKEIFAASWGGWLVLFIIGCFGLGEGLKATGFSHRFALWFITRPFVAGRPWVLLAMFLLACTITGSVMSGVGTCIVYMAIAKPILETLGYKKGDAFGAMFMMGIAWASTASMVITPIGHVGNIMVMDWIQRDFGYSITFPQWIGFGIPMGTLIFLMMLALFRYVIRPDVSRVKTMTIDDIRRSAGDVGPMTLEEKLSLGIFLTVVVCWMLPGLVSGILPEMSDYLTKMGYVIPPLAGCTLLCLIHIKNKPLMSFQQWMKDGVSWGTIALLGAIGILGKVIGDPATGIPEALTNVFQSATESAPVYAFVFVSVLWVVLQTNVMSNVVSLTLVYAIMVPASVAIGTGNALALGTTIAGASHFAFCLPSATAATAVIIGSGWVPTRFMARYGVMLILPITLIFTFLGYPLASFVFG